MVKLTPSVCRAARALLGWKQADLVKAAGMSATTVNKFEKGEEVTLASIAKIVAAFDAAGVQLFDGERFGARMKAKP